MKPFPLADVPFSGQFFFNSPIALKKKEENDLCEKSAHSKQHSRWQSEDSNDCFPYKSDVDRILHSNAYARYIDKTQAVYLVDNDHITHRSLHVQLVSRFARSIAEILRLNIDLVEAIALGHDVGHPPFGHEGEEYLSALAVKHGCAPFSHPLHSCRLFTKIEPLNLGLAVLDGFLCHDGGLTTPVLIPSFGKGWDDHFKDCLEKKAHPQRNIMPGTLEGCLVKLCDTMSYVGRDIEDAIQLGILSRKDVPETKLGIFNRNILSNLAKDIIEHSYGKDYIALSESGYEALAVLRRFNFERIYSHPKLRVESSKIKQSYEWLFEHLLFDLNERDKESYVWKIFLHKRREEYLAETSKTEQVIDYIAGMTDHYFIRTLEKMFIPSKIQI